jgi:predicted O-methyltransferase YrrM
MKPFENYLLRLLARAGAWPQLRPWALRAGHRFLARACLREIDTYEAIGGWLTPEEAVGLFLIGATAPNEARVVEIGSWKGKSTYCLARGLAGRGRLIAIDPFDASGEEGSAEAYSERRGEKPLYQQFEHNLKSRHAFDAVEPRRGYSQEFVDEVPPLDALFIDGNHSIEGCRFDYEHYAPHLRSGGLLAFHDYRSSRSDLGPTWVVDNLVRPSGRFRLVGLFGSLWVGQHDGQQVA